MPQSTSNPNSNPTKGLPVVQIPLINIQPSTQQQQQVNINVNNASTSVGPSPSASISPSMGLGVGVGTWHQNQIEYSQSIISNTAPQPSIPSHPPSVTVDLSQLRQEILSKIATQRAHFQRLITFWNVVYYSLGALGFAGNGLAVGLSSSNIRRIIQSVSGGSSSGTMNPDGTIKSGDEIDSTSQVIIAVGSGVSVVSYTLNAQLQSHMNATYFSEAVARYSQLEVELFETSLGAGADGVMGVWKKMQVLDGMYDQAGVGPMVSLGGLVESLGKLLGGGGGKAESGESKPGRPSPAQPSHGARPQPASSRTSPGYSPSHPTQPTSAAKPSRDLVDHRYVDEMPKRYAYPQPRVIQQRERREQRHLDAMQRQYPSQSRDGSQSDIVRGDHQQQQQRYFTYHP